MHIFTTDLIGIIVWEQYVDLGVAEGRILDVAVGNGYDVAVTGFIDYGAGPELYAALYDGAGNLMNDFQYTGLYSATGNNIIYSSINDQFIIGGFESLAYTLAGKALLIALDGGFNYQWATNYDAFCDDFGMASINDIITVDENYLITGNLSNAGPPYSKGQSQVLLALVDNASGSILDNASFVATNTLGGQQAMGVSAYYDYFEQTIVLLYNVSISPTVDENRPYIAVYDVSGASLNLNYGYRIDDYFPSNPSSFVDNPSFTGLKILPNKRDNTYLIFGMLDAYDQPDDMVLSVYQEIDLASGTMVAPAKYWSQSEIPTGAGYPAQGGFYSLFNPSTLNSDVYTPQSTTLSSYPKWNFVSILPTPGVDFAFDIISSRVKTSIGSSPCILDFEMAIVPHDIYADVCLEEGPASGSLQAPMNPIIMTSSTQATTCIINMSPALGNTDINLEDEMANELTLFANPAADVLRFSITENGNYDLIIMNIEGQILLKNKLNNNGSQNQINVANLATGVYIITAINDNGQTIQQHFVKN
ncbi:MAG: T9SS type A sorting domain-containing protein [Crocinitomix sp.]|nr:T9SS type A sorting domain-containing protein [Crocinitomix sp.]